MNKITIRKQLLQRRTSLSNKQSADLSAKIVNHIIGSALYQQAQHVALYLPFNGEVDISALLQLKHKQHYLPSIQGQLMQFQPFNSALSLIKHPYGFSQPAFIESLPAPELDLCLMPLVGFDMHGTRLGMGGGYYDRYFAPKENHTSHTQLAGVGYQLQQRDNLPIQNWDVKINHLFTEQGYFKL